MSKLTKLIVPAALAVFLPAADGAPAGAQAIAGQSVTLEAASVGTYGELLTDLARKAAMRAAERSGSDEAMEAISELAVRWLEMPEGATRVWDQHPRVSQSAGKAVRNAQRDLWRKERRHERIASAAPGHGSVGPSQQTAVELGETLDAIDDRDREILLCSAQGMNAREIGQHLGISHAAARQRLLRARRQLRYVG